MSGLPPEHGAAIGLDHVGIVGAGLDALAEAFSRLGFTLTPTAAHASGRTANRCAMLRDGGYLELIATLPGQASATIERFLTLGEGAHILALEVADLAAARDRLARAGIAAGEVSTTEREAGPEGGGTHRAKARFMLLMPPDGPVRPGPADPPSDPGPVVAARHHGSSKSRGRADRGCPCHDVSGGDDDPVCPASAGGPPSRILWVAIASPWREAVCAF